VPLLVIAPLLGIAIVPVTLPVGAGLTPSDVTSVAPSGIPVAPTDPPAPIPSGEVTPSEGVAVVGSSTWANAGHNKDQAVAKINNGLMKDSPIWPGARLCDIVNPSAVAREASRKISSCRCSICCPALRPASRVLRRTSKASLAPLFHKSRGWKVAGSRELFN